MELVSERTCTEHFHIWKVDRADPESGVVREGQACLCGEFVQVGTVRGLSTRWLAGGGKPAKGFA